jgi:hypothetical protein
LHQAAFSRERAGAPQPPRVTRLNELERKPPQWLVDTLGRPPGRADNRATNLLLWRRAALATDDYRSRLGARQADLREAPVDPALAQMHDAAWRVIRRYHDARSRGRERQGPELGR